MHHRERARPRTSKKPREHVAHAPNQVWCWDITHLHSSVRGAFVYLYLIVDIYSRKIVDWCVAAEESMEIAADLIERATGIEQVPADALVLHADNGGPMKGSTCSPRCTASVQIPRFADHDLTRKSGRRPPRNNALALKGAGYVIVEACGGSRGSRR